jgi:hypothetical protein
VFRQAGAFIPDCDPPQRYMCLPFENAGSVQSSAAIKKYLVSALMRVVIPQQLSALDPDPLKYFYYHVNTQEILLQLYLCILFVILS